MPLVSEIERGDIARRIADAPVERFPFAHLVVHDLLPPRAYDRLLTAWPTRQMAEVSRFNYGATLAGSQGIGARFHFARREDGGIESGPIDDAVGTLLYHRAEATPWIAFEDIYREAIMPALWRRLSPFVDHFLEGVCSPAWRDAVGDFMPAYRSGDLFTRSEAFELAPHTDNRWHLLTVLLYFPPDNDHEELGTQLFACEDGAALDPQYLKPRLAKTIPYCRNTLFCFANARHAFHGNAAIGDYRRNIYLNYVTLPIEAMLGALTA